MLFDGQPPESAKFSGFIGFGSHKLNQFRIKPERYQILVYAVRFGNQIGTF